MIAFNARAMMEKAIEVMRQSVAERRGDGKPSPKVGAVLIDMGDEVSNRQRMTTAYRGELREGDHAEFTLLERKNRDQKLDQCVLFATLEPCAPKARSFPKLGCAERIVNARIKEVWIGIEDPDPTVDRKGIRFLQENGVTVHMFDRDLQEVIRAENKEFLEKALERAAVADEPTPEVTLSPLENAAANCRMEELSSVALDAYRDRAKITEATNSVEFNRRLVRQGLLQPVGSQFTPTGFGLLLFGKEPRTLMPQAGLLATIHFPDGTEEIQNFEGPQVLVPEQAMQWLRDKLPNLIDRSAARRRQTSDPLFELVREGIVNALVHRDYSIQGAKCQLVVTPDTIEVRSPGKPVEPITLEQVQSFDAPMLSRNPTLHFVFAQMDLAEERGLGLKSMQRRAEQAKLPLPKFVWKAPYLVLTCYRSPTAATTSLPESVQSELTAAERKGWQWLTTQGRAKSTEYAKVMDIDSRTARRQLNRFLELGLIRKIGSARSTDYEVLGTSRPR